MLGSAAQNVANFVGKTKILAIHHALIPSTLDRFLQYIRYLDVNGAKSDALRTLNPNQAGQRSDDCGQLVKAC
jgi:hypothetical protein